MIYNFLRPLAEIAVKQHFREVHVRGEPLEDGPIIAVANHPNALLDVLLVATSFERQLWFTAKSTIFSSKLAAFLLKRVNVVPIYRRQDSPESMEQNQASFARVTECLQQEQAVLIFPEGMSRLQRKIMDVKTGAARMAFLAEAEADFSLDLKIQPIGITYSDFFRYNSSVTLIFGEPISVADFKEQYESDEREGVKSLSAEIENHLRDLTVEVVNEDYVKLVTKLGKLYQSRGREADDHERLTLVAENVVRVVPKIPERVKDLEKLLSFYLQLSSALKLDGSEDFETKRGVIWFLILTPFVLLGVLLHFIPFKLAIWLSRKMSTDRAGLASWGLSAGVIIFLVWYVLCWLAGLWLAESIDAATMFLVAIVGTGYMGSKYFNRVALFLFSTFWPGQKTPIDVLKKMRSELIAEFESLREV